MPAYKTAFCRSCNAAIIWCVSPAGKIMPLDARPSDQLPEPLPKVLYRIFTNVDNRLEAARWTGDPGVDLPTLYASHFATCPNAAQHSRR